MYNVDDKLGFIAHPRTASRSVAVALRLSCGVPTERIESHHQVDEEEVYRIYQKGGIMVCTVRNIFDILVSWYHNVPEVEVKPTFTDFVTKLIEDPSQRWFRGRIYHYGLGYCNHVMRYENLQEDFDRVMEIAGLPHTGLPLVGESLDRKGYRSYYDDETRQRVEDHWHDDLLVTGYSF